MNYQVYLAILKVLELIGIAKNAPHKLFRLTFEPRVVAEGVTTWDMLSHPDNVVTEAKLAPTRSDVTEWLARVRQSGHTGEFDLICSKRSGSLLSDVDVLSRLARESADDVARFDQLAHLQHVTHESEIRTALGPDCHKLLQRVHIENLHVGISFGGRIMIQRLRMLVLLTAVAIPAAHDFHATAQSTGRQSREDHVAWVAQALERMQTIKPGMTRRTLLTVFTTEGGLSTGLHRTFVSRDCPYFKVDVEFQAVGRPDRDGNGRVTLVEDGQDIILKISRPYLEFTIAD